jgi:hypothetical protein
MSRLRRAALLAIMAGAGTAGCAGYATSFDSTWHDPQAAPVSFNKVMALAITKEEGSRRSFEDQMVRAIAANGRAEGVAAYRVLAGVTPGDSAQARAAAEAAGVDGLVTMRLLGVDTEQRLVGGMPAPAYYGHPWGYYGYGWGTMYSPTYLETDRMVQIETNIYSLAQNKLIWSGRSRTTNPESMEQLVSEVAQAVGGELRKQGLMPERK